jgi:hypothetical protein
VNQEDKTGLKFFGALIVAPLVIILISGALKDFRDSASSRRFQKYLMESGCREAGTTFSEGYEETAYLCKTDFVWGDKISYSKYMIFLDEYER